MATPNSASEVRREIERAREQISASALALREEMAAKTDWRQWFRYRPGAWLLGALALGFLLGNRRR
jgi:hypothetical protein